MKSLSQHILTLAICMASLLIASPATAQALLDDNFDTARNDQDLPSSSAWYLRGNANSLTAGTGAMVLDSSGSTLNLVSYFTGSGSPYTLSEGETMTLTIHFEQSAINDSNSGMRFGLFNSGGNRVTGDSTNFLSSTFDDYSGYSVWYNPANTSASYNILERIGSSDAIFASGSSVNSVLGAGNSSNINMTADTETVLSLSISRTASGVSIVSSVNGVVLSRDDLGSTEFSYDTIALQVGSSMLSDGDLMTFNQVSVQVIPEPSHMAFGIGAVLILLISLRHKQSRK